MGVDRGLQEVCVDIVKTTSGHVRSVLHLFKSILGKILLSPLFLVSGKCKKHRSLAKIPRNNWRISDKIKSEKFLELHIYMS
jgi:hypothetical protein